jgi:hypothetical protein
MSLPLYISAMEGPETPIDDRTTFTIRPALPSELDVLDLPAPTHRIAMRRLV